MARLSDSFRSHNVFFLFSRLPFSTCSPSLVGLLFSLPRDLSSQEGVRGLELPSFLRQGPSLPYYASRVPLGTLLLPRNRRVRGGRHMSQLNLDHCNGEFGDGAGVRTAVLSALASFTVGLCNGTWLHSDSSQLSLQVSTPSSLQIVLVGDVEEVVILWFRFWSLRGFSSWEPVLISLFRGLPVGPFKSSVAF